MNCWLMKICFENLEGTQTSLIVKFDINNMAQLNYQFNDMNIWKQEMMDWEF